MNALESSRPYLSIGETLNLLKDEFPDVTVSKIRFLESEDLVHPERTPSGYRRFSVEDIERLKFILRLQRDQFLPLKVIRERLAEWRPGEAGQGQPRLALGAETEAEAEAEAESEPAPEPPAPPQAPEPVDDWVPLATGVSMTLSELAGASGLGEKQLRELESFGLIHPKDAGVEGQRYDEIALEVSKLCAELFRLGLEPRHLRMFRSTVDRWAGLAEQMVLPLVKQRNPQAKAAASETVRGLVRTGNKLVQTLLREAVAPYA